jgi:hypothetical protein
MKHILRITSFIFILSIYSYAGNLPLKVNHNLLQSVTSERSKFTEGEILVKFKKTCLILQS